MDKNTYITIHMVSSLDGFIATKDDDMTWFETAHIYDKGVEAEDTETFLNTIDAYVMGARTYELAAKLFKDYGWAYGEKPVIVLTQGTLPKVKDTVMFYAGGEEALIREHLQPFYKNIWVVGGAVTAVGFLKKGLADEICVSILPILLGKGLPFFQKQNRTNLLKLLDTKAYKNGMVELRYAVVKEI